MERERQRNYPLVRKILAERERSRAALDTIERERSAEGQRRDAPPRQAENPKAASGRAPRR